MRALQLTVIGGGSVGMGVAASFAIGGARVTLLVRAASMEVLRTQGVQVTYGNLIWGQSAGFRAGARNQPYSSGLP